MERSLIDQVRRFHRTVTQRVGALNDAYLERGHSLGQSRILWEIGTYGGEVRALRERLELDSGYLSRVLRKLEKEGLVEVGADDADARVRVARLTSAGKSEVDILDERSDELAFDILRPLSHEQRDRLVSAMAEVDRLLTASTVQVQVTHPQQPSARFCLGEFTAELHERFDHGFDPAKSSSVDDHEITPPAGVLLVATLHGEPVACGAVKLHGDGYAEIKRMWVSPAVRGLGVGRRVLGELERFAVRHGAQTARLETNRRLTQAIALYRGHGYREVDPFSDDPYTDHWFEKILDPKPLKERE